MAGLQPYARLFDLTSSAGEPLATTTNIIDYSFEIHLDAVGSFSLEVPAGDPGDAGSGGLSFGAALLQAAADLGAVPKPLLLELSLDGGASFDTRKLAEQPLRTLKASARTVREDGADLGSILATIPVERVTFTDCKLSDVFNGNPDHLDAGTIQPLTRLGFTDTIPSLYGLLTVTPGLAAGLAAWDPTAMGRLKFTGVISPAIADTATNVDVDSATTLAACETVVNRLAGAAPDQAFGHYVLDPSDASLNLSSSTSFAPTPPATARSFVVGNKGTTAHLLFDATSNEDVDETTTARVHLDAATVKTDDTTLYAAANFVGGTSTAGFPDGARVTGLTILNGTTPTMSSTKDDWRDGVPLIGINVNDASGGLYFTVLDGTIRPVPGAPAAPCQSIAVDLGQASPYRASALLMGTNHGIYLAEALDLKTGGASWSLLGDLNANVVRMQVEIDRTDPTHRVVFAFVKGSGERSDGIYRWTHNTGDSNPLHGTWDTVLQNTNVVDMIATDFAQVWAVLSKPQNVLGRYAVTSGRGDLEQSYTLPSTGQIQRIQEVVTVAHGSGLGAVPAQDSVWVLCAGAPSPAYYLVNSGDNYRTDGAGHTLTFTDANSDSTLVGPGDTPLQLNRVVGLGISFDGTVAQAFAGTDQGVYFTTAALGGALNWKSANEQGGLAIYNIKNVVAGEAQQILGKTTNRIYCTTEDDLLYSNSSGRWWQTIKGRDRTDSAAHLSTITLSINDANGVDTGKTLPYNRVRSWGSRNSDGTLMSTSPIGAGAGTHVTIPPTIVVAGETVVNPDAPPAGYYWERYLDQHLDYQYRLVSQTCPFPGLQMAQLPELQTNASVDPDTASKGVMMVARKWLQQHAVPQTVLEITSSFSTSESALRTLRPTHKCALRGQVQITDVSSQGAAVTTRVLDFDGTEPLYVLSHTVRRGVGMTAITTTVLGTELLEKPLSEQDIAAALLDSVQAVKVWRP